MWKLIMLCLVSISIQAQSLKLNLIGPAPTVAHCSIESPKRFDIDANDSRNVMALDTTYQRTPFIRHALTYQFTLEDTTNGNRMTKQSTIPSCAFILPYSSNWRIFVVQTSHQVTDPKNPNKWRWVRDNHIGEVLFSN